MGIRAAGEGRDLSYLSGKFTVYKRYPEQSRGSQPLEVTPLGLNKPVLNKPCCSSSSSSLSAALSAAMVSITVGHVVSPFDLS